MLEHLQPDPQPSLRAHLVAGFPPGIPTESHVESIARENQRPIWTTRSTGRASPNPPLCPGRSSTPLYSYTHGKFPHVVYLAMLRLLLVKLRILLAKLGLSCLLRTSHLSARCSLIFLFLFVFLPLMVLQWEIDPYCDDPIDPVLPLSPL